MPEDIGRLELKLVAANMSRSVRTLFPEKSNCFATT